MLTMGTDPGATIVSRPRELSPSLRREDQFRRKDQLDGS
jgi:hypothetical protein